MTIDDLLKFVLNFNHDRGHFGKLTDFRWGRGAGGQGGRGAEVPAVGRGAEFVGAKHFGGEFGNQNESTINRNASPYYQGGRSGCPPDQWYLCLQRFSIYSTTDKIFIYVCRGDSRITPTLRIE